MINGFFRFTIAERYVCANHNITKALRSMYKPKGLSGLSHLECDQCGAQELLGVENDEDVGVTSRAVLRDGSVI